MTTPLDFDAVALVILLGSLQGFVLGAAILARRPRRPANRLLGALILIFALDMAFVYALETVDFRRAPHLIGISDPFTLLYGPLLYLYARTLAGRAPLRRRDLAHGLPAALHALSLIPIFLAAPAAKIAYWEGVITGDCGWRTPVTAALNLGLSFAYLVAAFRLTSGHRRAIRDRFSDVERISLDWLRFLTGSALGLWAVAMALFLVQRLWTNVGEWFGLTYLGITVLIYAIGWLGLRQPEIFGEARPEREPEPAAASPKYEKTRLDDATAEALRAGLLAHMDAAAPHRRSGLTLQELADDLGRPAHHVSQVINDRLGVNFYDFVNGYRVEEVKRRLLDPADAHLTVLSLALDAGFSSKSAFNAIFKKLSGRTPSEYRRDAGGS